MGTRHLAIGFVLASSIATTASANVADEAEFFDALGRRAYAAHQYERALEAFLQVHEIAPSPRTLYNIAYCAELAGKRDVAFAQYREYLQSGDTDAARLREAARRVARLATQLALIEVTSDPPGAEIFVDRKELGQYGVTPRTIAVDAGERVLMLELPGHASEAVRPVATVGALVPVAVTLKPQLGELAVEVSPGFATLELLRAEQPVASSLVDGHYPLPVGQYTIVVSAPGHVTQRARVVIRESEPTRLVLALIPLPRATGRLLVTAGKQPAVVFVDGRRVAVAPATLPGLDVGEHVVELRAGSHSARRVVHIRAEHATYLEVDLSRGGR